MEILTRDLRPSKYTYLLANLKEEFETDYFQLRDNGILIYEITPFITICKLLFEWFRFSEETKADSYLRYSILREIQGYLKNTFRSQNLTLSYRQ